ncbi:hypothetical protein [uncultured Ruminococcus sp.]|uniref:DUF3592 domain-containing protein n=1 Tax=uncultured Ruminococcus sp. TaxID=165186 RepID=UPI00260D4D9D|nr:hypothetical protein [uncultured Ruminococcus sp.]
MEHILVLAGAAVIIALAVFLSKLTKGTAQTVNTAADVHRYRNGGHRRTGREPELWHYADGGTGLALKYTIDGEEVKGVLDRGFTFSEEELRSMAEAGEDIDIITDPDNPKRFCLAREFYSSGHSERFLAEHRKTVGSVKMTWFNVKAVIFFAELAVGAFLVFSFLAMFAK